MAYTAPRETYFGCMIDEGGIYGVHGLGFRDPTRRAWETACVQASGVRLVRGGLVLEGCKGLGLDLGWEGVW